VAAVRNRRTGRRAAAVLSLTMQHRTAVPAMSRRTRVSLSA
jgi:hypothetical protein